MIFNDSWVEQYNPWHQSRIRYRCHHWAWSNQSRSRRLCECAIWLKRQIGDRLDKCGHRHHPLYTHCQKIQFWSVPLKRSWQWTRPRLLSQFRADFNEGCIICVNDQLSLRDQIWIPSCTLSVCHQHMQQWAYHHLSACHWRFCGRPKTHHWPRHWYPTLTTVILSHCRQRRPFYL